MGESQGSHDGVQSGGFIWTPEGSYFVLQSSHVPTPPSQSHLHPSSPILQKPSQASAGPKVSDPIGPASGSTSVATSSVSEGNLLADMQPLRIQLGGAKRGINAGLRAAKRAHPPHELPFVLT